MRAGIEAAIEVRPAWVSEAGSGADGVSVTSHIPPQQPLSTAFQMLLWWDDPRH